MQHVGAAYRLRFYPTPEQANLLTRTFGCVRIIYNRARADAWKARKKRVGFSQANAMLTVTREADGRWYVSCRVVAEVPTLEGAAEAVGIDLGLVHFATSVEPYLGWTLSAGEKIGNPRHLAKRQGKVARLRRRLARKKKGSNNRHEARVAVARTLAKVRHCRADFLHRLSTLVRMLSYKAIWSGRRLVRIDRWHPSTKTCGARHARGVRHWRDVNAANNVRAAGLAVPACGEGVSLGVSRHSEQSSMKQEPVS